MQNVIGPIYIFHLYQTLALFIFFIYIRQFSIFILSWLLVKVPEYNKNTSTLILKDST